MNFLKIESKNFLEMVKNSKTETTYQTYKIVLENAIDYIIFDNNHLSIKEYRIKIAHQNRKTIAKKISILRSFINFLENKGYNFRIVGDEEISVPKTISKTVSLENIKKALKVANLIEYTTIITIFGLGLKISEARSILLKNIKEEYVTIISFNKNKTRDIPLEKHVKDTINKYREVYSPKKYFFEKNGVQMSNAQIRYIIEKSFKKIGIKVTPNQLRVSFAKEMLKNGAKIISISKLLGNEFIASIQFFIKINSFTKLKNYLKAHPLCYHF